MTDLSDLDSIIASGDFAKLAEAAKELRVDIMYLTDELAVDKSIFEGHWPSARSQLAAAMVKAEKYAVEHPEHVDAFTPDDGWTPVEEGKPKPWEYVSVTILNDEVTTIAFYMDGEWTEAFGGRRNTHVLAWQPLPAPYKAKEAVK